MTVPILAYHNISNDFQWGINNVSPRLFEKQVKYLADNDYSTISLNQYIENDFNVKKPVIITFDDAYQSIVEYAFPIMERYGFKATVFVVSDYIGKKNSWDVNLGGVYTWHLNLDNIKKLVTSGWEIGSHTVTHPDLQDLHSKALSFELAYSKFKLESLLGIDIHFISYPFNRYSSTVLDMAAQTNYKGGCCLAQKTYIPEKYFRYMIPRSGVYAIDHMSLFKLKFRNHTFSRIDHFRQKVISTCATGSVIYKRLLH